MLGMKLCTISVVEELKEKGAIFVDELSDVDDVSRPVIFSAHGVPKSVPEEAKLKNLSFVDAMSSSI